MAIVGRAEIEVDLDARRATQQIDQLERGLTGFVGRGVKRFNDGIDAMDGRLKKLGFSSRDVSILMGAGLAGGVAFAAREVFRFVDSAIEATSALEEQRSASQAIFEENQRLVQSFAETAEALGFSERAALQATSTFGGFFQNIGLGEEASARLATGFTALSADLASFFNIDTQTASDRLISGLRGEQEAVERLNVNISEGIVLQRAMAEGLGGTADEVSLGERVFARALIILEQTAKAQGDVERTSESLANQQRRLNAEYENSKAILGERLIPVKIFLNKVLSETLDSITALTQGTEDFSEQLNALKEEGTEVFQLFGTRFGFRTRIEGEETNALQKLRDLLRGVDFAAEDAADTSDELGGAFDELEDPANRAAVAAEKLKDVTEDLAKAQEKLESATDRAADAERRLNRAFEDFELRTDRAERALAEAREDRADREAEGRKRIDEAKLRGTERIEEARERLNEFTLDAANREADAERRLIDLHRQREFALLRGQQAVEAAVAAGDAQAENAARLALAEEQRNTDVTNATIELSADRAEAARQLDELEEELADAKLERARDIKEAQEDLAKTIEEADERIADAERGVTDAYRDASRAIEDATEALEEANISLGKAQSEVEKLTADFKDLNKEIDKTVDKYADFRELFMQPLQGPEFVPNGDLGVFTPVPVDENFLEDWFGGSTRALGGPVSSGRPYLVGEQGPEVFMPGTSGTIVSNDQLIQALREAGGAVTINVYPQTTDPRAIANELAFTLASGRR